jgi:hypothetical protein
MRDNGSEAMQMRGAKIEYRMMQEMMRMVRPRAAAHEASDENRTMMMRRE